MSFDYPQEPRRRKKGGISGLVMLMIIGLGLFALMNMRGGGAGNDGGAVEGNRRPVENRSQGKLDPRIDRELRQADEYRRQRESVLGDAKSESARRPVDSKTMPSGSSQKNGDWTITDVDGKKKAGAPKAKKTTGEDGWSIEDVPTKKKSGTGFEASKSGGGDVKVPEKSDWSVEDVEPKTKKTTEGDWSVEEVGGGN